MLSVENSGYSSPVVLAFALPALEDAEDDHEKVLLKRLML